MPSFLKKIKKHYKTKLILCFLLCSVVPILIIGFISYNTSTRIAKDKILDSVKLSSQQITTQIDNRMLQIENLTDSIYFNLYTLHQAPETPLSEYMSQFGTVRNNINSLATAFDIYHVSVFVDSSSLISNEGVYFTSLEHLANYQVAKEEISNLGVSPTWLFRSGVDFPYVVDNGNPPSGTLACYRSLGKTSETLEFAYGIYLNSNEFSDILLASYADSGIHSYITDRYGTIVASKNNLNIGTSLEEKMWAKYSHEAGRDVFSWDSKHVYLLPLSNDFYLATEIPNSYITQNTRVLVNIILVMLILIIPVTLIAIIYVSQGLTQKLKRLSQVMLSTKVSQNKIQSFQLLDLLPKNASSCDEIDQLTLTYQDMLVTLDDSYHEILDLSIKEEKLNYQLLQSQINPHFLYNILNSAQTCLSLGRFDIADQMLSDLSRFYKSILRKPNELISIQEELEISTLYLEMESLCKNGIFTWNIELDEGIEHFLICKFTLQPILENSIIHGSRGGNVSLHIEIRVSYQEDTILITIKDNGIGIDAQQLQEIQQELKEKSVNYNKHFGIGNINARLASSLQEYGSMEIESIKGEGTTTHIMIPQVLE